jgi:Flp pilus assembly protein TadD
MTQIAHGIGYCTRVGLLMAALVGTPAFADDYAPVNELLRSGQFSAAMDKADQYLAKNPRDPQMQFLRALIQQDAGRQADAIASYTKLIEAYPELPEPYNNVAVLYAAQGQYEKARVSLEMATRTSRSYATAYENLGDVYARLASQSYSQAQQLEPGNTSIAPKLALIRQLIGNPAQAKSAATTDRARPPTPAASTAR